MPYSSNHKVTKRLLAGRCIGSPSKQPSIVLSLSFTQDDSSQCSISTQMMTPLAPTQKSNRIARRPKAEISVSTKNLWRSPRFPGLGVNQTSSWKPQRRNLESNPCLPLISFHHLCLLNVLKRWLQWTFVGYVLRKWPRRNCSILTPKKKSFNLFSGSA